MLAYTRPHRTKPDGVPVLRVEIDTTSLSYPNLSPFDNGIQRERSCFSNQFSLSMQTRLNDRPRDEHSWPTQNEQNGIYCFLFTLQIICLPTMVTDFVLMGFLSVEMCY